MHLQTKGKNTNFVMFNSPYSKPIIIGIVQINAARKHASFSEIPRSHLVPVRLPRRLSRHIVILKRAALDPKVAPNRGILNRSYS